MATNAPRPCVLPQRSQGHTAAACGSVTLATPREKRKQRALSHMEFRDWVLLLDEHWWVELCFITRKFHGNGRTIGYCCSLGTPLRFDGSNSFHERCGHVASPPHKILIVSNPSICGISWCPLLSNYTYLRHHGWSASDFNLISWHADEPWK